MKRNESTKNRISTKKKRKPFGFGTIRKHNSKSKTCDICSSRFVNGKNYPRKIPLTTKGDITYKLCRDCNNELTKFNNHKKSGESYTTVLFKSRIVGAGLGLYALKDFKKGDIITEYNGEREKNDIGDSKNKTYLLEVGRNKVVDGNPRLSTNKFDLLKLGAYANDLSYTGQIHSNLKNNAFFQSLYDMNIPTINLIANKDINTLEEIYAFYKYEK